MAKILVPFVSEQDKANFKAVVRAYELNTVLVGRFFTKMPKPTQTTIDEQRILYTNARASWDVLATWKKTRWTLCAFAQLNLPNFQSDPIGFGGYSLYMREWLMQRPAAGKQPISPCSARVTDPNASPWDYQP